MKRDDPYQDVAELLRSQQPDPLPSPYLEFRILRALDRQQRPAPGRWWPWLALPPALAAAALMLDHRPSHPETHPPVALTAMPVESPIQPSISQVLAGNPLKTETRLLGRDVERAGNFLVNCLPSIRSE